MSDEAAALRDPRAFKQLEEKLYADKNWVELVAAYGSRAQALEDPDQKERLFFQAGQIAEKNQQDPAAAIVYYRKAFEVRKSFVRALGALRALVTDRKDWKAVAESVELELPATTEPPKKARLYKELGDALAHQEGLDPEEPIKAYAKALELDPKQRTALTELEKLCRKHNKWNKLVAAYKKLGDASFGKDAAVFHFLAGGILEDKIKAPDLAQKAYKASLGAGPDDIRILGTITSFFEKRKAWEDAVAALEAQVPLGENAKEKAKLLRRIGSHCEKGLANPDLARVHYRRAVDARPDDAEALARLKALAEAKNDDAGLADALELEANNLELSPEEKAERFEKAAERREKAGDFEVAVLDLQAVIQVKARSPRALKSLERLTRKLGRWPDHARALELQAALLDPSRSPEEKAATLRIERSLVEVREKYLADQKGALASLSRILSIDPDDLDAMARVESLARKQKDWPRVAQALARRAEKTREDPARAQLSRELARLRDTELQDPKGAAEAWEDALSRDPSLGAEALPALRVLYARTRDAAGLAKTIGRLVERSHAAPAAERAELLLALGIVELDRGEPAASLKALREAIALDPDGAVAVESRRRIVDAARKKGDVEGLRRALADVGSRDPEAAPARAARLELARLEEKEHRPADALKVLEEQLALAPADEEALPHAARLLAALGLPLEAAERLEVASRSLESQDAVRAASFARDEARILEREAQSRGARREPPAQGEFLPPPPAKLDPEAFQAFEVRARQAWQRVLELAPEDDTAAERIADLCRRTGDAAGLDLVLERATGRTAVAPTRARLNRERAALARGPRKRPDEAAVLYERVLKDSPNDGDATVALLELYEQLERWPDLADLLEAVAAREQTGEKTRATDRLALPRLDKGAAAVPDFRGALRRAATVAAEKLADPARAVACLERVAERVPDDDETLAVLAGYLEKLARPRDLERVLDKRAALAPDPHARATLLLRRGHVLARELGDHAEASKAFERCLEARPGDREALEGLARARNELGDLPGATRALAAAAESALAEGDALGAARLELARGDMARTRRDFVEAEAAYRAAVDRAPSLDAAHDALVSVLTQRSDWPAVESALGAAALAVASQAAGGERRSALLVQRAEVLSARLEKGDDALRALDEADGAAPRSATVYDARARILRRLHRAPALAEALAARRALAAAVAPPRGARGANAPAAQPSPGALGNTELVGLLREEAHLRAFELGDLDKARALLDEARKLSPDDARVIGDLLKVERRGATVVIEGGGAGAVADGGKGGDAKRLLGLLERAAELEKAPARRGELLVEAGRTAKLKLLDPVRARTFFEAALAASPNGLEAVRWLQGLAREAEDLEALAVWLARETQIETDPKRRALAHAKLGDCERRRGRPDDAKRAYEKALSDDPKLLPALRHLAPLLRRAKDWKGLGAMLDKLARLEPDKHAKVERLVMLGELRQRRLDDQKGARAAYEEALALAPEDIHALRGRAKTLDEKKEAKELVQTLETELRLTPAAARRADIQKRIGFLKQEHLNDLEGAAKAFSAALRIRPDDDKARDALRYVHMAARDWSKLANSYEEEARRTTDRKIKEERFRQAALVRHHHLKDLEKATALYKEVLALGDPECIAIQALPALLADPSKEEERHHVLSRIAEIVPGSPEAQEALLELGGHAEKRGDRPAAQARYEQLLQKTPGHRRALDALIALHRSANDLARLAEVLDRKRATLEGEESARVRLDRGRVLEELRDLDAAALEYEEALKEDKDGREAIARLRSVYQRREKFQELVRTLALAVARAGGRARDASGAVAALAETDAVRLLLEKATVEETRLKNPRAALESIRSAWTRATSPSLAGDVPLDRPGEKTGLTGNLLRHEVADRWIELVRAEDLDDELAQALARKAAIVPEGPGRARVLVDLARTLEKLSRHEAAIEAWDHALEQDPTDRPALAALAALCERTKDRRGHARALEREMELLAKLPQISSADLERLASCALGAAKIHQELENDQAAVRALERALDRAPDSKAVHEALAKIHEARDHDAALYDVLRRRAQVSTDRSEQARVRERMAKIAEQLGDDEAAIRDWGEVLVRRPRDRQAMQALKRLHSAREEWAEAAEVSEREVVVVSELSARQTASGGAPAEPPPGFTGAFKMPDVLKGLEPGEAPPPGLDFSGSGGAEGAGDKNAESSHEGFAAVLPDLSELHLALGELYERRLRKRASAKEHYELAHARRPGDPRPLRGLERLHQDDQEWAKLSQTRAALRDLEEDPQKRASLAVGIAAAEERLGKRAEAIAALKGALTDVPDNPNALALLRQHLIEATRWAEAADVLAREAEVSRERETILLRRIELGKLALAKLDDAKRAQTELERARELDPSNADVLAHLEKIYAASGDRPRLAKVLDDQARYAPDEPAADLLAREGRVLSGVEELPGSGAEPTKDAAALAAAAEAYERALLRVPGRAGVLDALLDLYERLGKSKDLARALHRRSELATSETAVAGFERRAAEVEERELEDPTAAARTLDQLVARAGKGPVAWDLDGALSELARLRAALGEHAAREQALARRTALATTNDARRTLLLERARVLEERLQRPGAAAACVQEVLALFPEDAALADELARLREAAGDAPGIVRALDHALGLTKESDQERLKALHRRRAELCAGLAYDPEKALESLRVLLGMDPEDDASRESLEAILSREGRARDLALHYAAEVERRRAKREGAQVLAGLERRRAELFRGPLSDPESAEKAFRAALALDVDDARAREGLEALLRAEGHQEALAALLAENAARATSDLIAAEALREEAQVHEQRGDRATAIERLESAQKRTPDDRRTLRALVRLYRLEERREDLARVLALLVKALGTAPPAERSAVLLERGLVLKELGKLDQSEAVLEEALDLDSKSVPAARALVPLLLARSAWKQVARTYELESQAKVDRGRRVWLRCEIGRLRFEQLADPEGAARAYQEALALEPGSVSALQGLARVLRAHGRPGDLAMPLEKIAELAPSPEDRINANRELAHLLEEKLGEPRLAAERYSAVLAEHPEDQDAVRGLARSLRALVQAGDQRARASLALALGRELDLETDVPRRFALLSEVAGLEETLAEESQDPEVRKKRLEASDRAAAEACELKPQDADALATFARVAEKLGKWKELAEATEALAGLLDDKQRAAWMLRRAGKLRAHRLADAPGAASAFEAAAQVDPRDREALEALEPIARELRDHDRLLGALRGQLALAPDDARRAVVSLRVGEVHESAGDFARAIESYVLAREKGKAPQRKDAQKALDRCYRATERWTDLARVLEARAEAEPETAAQLLLERARVLDERLSRYDKAAESIRAALKLADDAAAARWLERLLIQMARWDELAEHYENESARRGARGYEALVKLGKLLRDQLDDQERAAQALQKAVQLQPGGLEAIEALRDLYMKTESWPELLEVQRLEIGLQKDARAREKALVRAARVAEEKLGDLAQAARFFAEASQLAPQDRGHLSALARVQEARGDEEGLVRTLERDLVLTRDPVEVVTIRKHLGLVYAKRLFQRNKAIATYLGALELAPEDDEALAALADLYRSGEQWGELAAVLDRRAQRARGKEGLQLRLELARVLAGKLDRGEDALRMAAAARAIDPRAVEATEIEVEVLRGRGGKEDLAEALARLAATKEVPGERATVLVELAKHLEETLQRPDRALKALDEALARDPVHEAALARATRLQEAAERWDELFATYERAFQATEDKAKRGPLRARGAEVLERRKRDLPRAEKLYREAIADAPEHLPAVAGLARVLTATGAGKERADDKRDDKSDKRALELARLEERTAELERAPEEKARALARAGDVHRNALGDLPTAQNRYEAALALAPDLFAALAPLAELLFGAEQLDRALTLLERCAVAPELGNDPEHAAELLHALALAREHKKDREGAAAALRSALEHKAGHAQALEDLGRLLSEDGAYAAAVPVLEDLVARTRVPAVRATHELSLAKALAKLAPQGSTGPSDDKALDLFKRGLEKQPDDQEAREAYGFLLKKRGQDEAAARELLKVEGAKDPARRARVLLGLAELEEGSLENPERAAAHLRAAIDVEGKHRGQAARRLAEIHARAERWGDAVLVLGKAVELEPDVKERAELYAKLGRLFRDRLRNLDMARRCLEKALDLDPVERHTLDSLARLLEGAGEFDALEAAYGKSADALKAAKQGDEVSVRVRRAEVLWKRLRKLKPAAREYEAVLSLEPKHAGGRSALVQIYMETGDTSALERLVRDFVRDDPLAVDHYRTLEKAWGRAGKGDARNQALQALAVLAACEREEREEVVDATRAEAHGRRGLAEDDWSNVLPEDLHGATGELVTMLSEHFDRAVPDDLKNYGIGMLKRSLSLDGNAFDDHRLVKRVLDLLGIEEGDLDLYWMADWKRPEAILGHGKRPSLILCPMVFQGLDAAEKAFVVARAVALVPAGLEAANALPGRKLERLILAAAKTLDPEHGMTLSTDDDKEIRAFTSRLTKALTPELVARLKPAATQVLASADRLDIEGFRRSVALAASRAGVLAAGGVFPAAHAIAKTNVALHGRIPQTTAEVVKAFREFAELRGILEFSVSQGYLETRRGLGLARD